MFSASLSGRVSGIAAALALCLQSASAAVGDVDVSYAGGAPVFAFPAVDAAGVQAQLLTGGQLLLATRCENAFCLRKVGADGVLDLGYGSGGLLKLNAGSRLVALGSGQLQALGASGTGWAVTRLKADGSVDTSFGTQGVRNLAAPADDFVLGGLVAQSTEYNLVLGRARSAPGQASQIFLSRLTPQGEWDSSFFGAGRVFVPVTINGQVVGGTAVAAVENMDNRLWVISQTDPASGHHAIALSRHFLNGQLDTAFTAGGVWVLWAGGPSRAVDVRRDANGRVLVLGERTDTGAAVLWAFKKAEYLDTSFGVQGRADLVDVTHPTALNVMADGRMLVASDQGVVRLTAKGARDTGSAGASEWKLPAGVNAQWQQMRLQRNGRALLAGSDAGKVRVVRFLNDDITPAPFAFPAKTGVTTGAVLISDEAAISGIDAAAAVSITGGTYAIVDTGKCNDSATTYTSADGVFVPGAKRLCVRVTASSENSATTKATLTVGDVAADFSVTTAAKAEEKKKDKSGSAGLLMLVAGVFMAYARRRAGLAGRRAN